MHSSAFRHLCCSLLIALATVLVGCGKYPSPGYDGRESYKGAKGKSVYDSGPIDRAEAVDEARGGYTLRGTPVSRRTDRCFPAEPRDLFWQMDQVVWEKGHLEPLDFDEDRSSKTDPDTGIVMSGVSDSERDAIRGRNTWLLWGGGNETFWGWLQEEGYGLTDFLILMDSRERKNRFKTAGLINQPGFASNDIPLLGL